MGLIQQKQVNGLVAEISALNTLLDLKSDVGHTHDAADIVSGQMANAQISESSVTQHQAALAIDWNQLTGVPSLDNYDHWTVHTNNGSYDIESGGSISIMAGDALDMQHINGSNVITLHHEDTSSQGSLNLSNGFVVQDIFVDGYGHVTNLNSVDLDARYYTETEIDTFRATHMTIYQRSGESIGTGVTLDLTELMYQGEDITHYNTNSIRVSNAGWYRVNFHVTLERTSGTEGTFMRGELHINSTTHPTSTVYTYLGANLSAGWATLHFSGLVELSANDILDIYIEKHSGGAGDVETVPAGTSFSAQRVS